MKIFNHFTLLIPIYFPIEFLNFDSFVISPINDDL